MAPWPASPALVRSRTVHTCMSSSCTMSMRMVRLHTVHMCTIRTLMMCMQTVCMRTVSVRKVWGCTIHRRTVCATHANLLCNVREGPGRVGPGDGWGGVGGKFAGENFCDNAALRIFANFFASSVLDPLAEFLFLQFF